MSLTNREKSAPNREKNRHQNSTIFSPLVFHRFRPHEPLQLLTYIPCLGVFSWWVRVACFSCVFMSFVPLNEFVWKSSVSRRAGHDKGGVSKYEQTQTNADKRWQMQANAEAKTQASARKRGQMQTNAYTPLYCSFLHPLGSALKIAL